MCTRRQVLMDHARYEDAAQPRLHKSTHPTHSRTNVTRTHMYTQTHNIGWDICQQGTHGLRPHESKITRVKGHMSQRSHESKVTRVKGHTSQRSHESKATSQRSHEPRTVSCAPHHEHFTSNNGLKQTSPHCRGLCTL